MVRLLGVVSGREGGKAGVPPPTGSANDCRPGCFHRPVLPACLTSKDLLEWVTELLELSRRWSTLIPMLLTSAECNTNLQNQKLLLSLFLLWLQSQDQSKWAELAQHPCVFFATDQVMRRNNVCVLSPPHILVTLWSTSSVLFWCPFSSVMLVL